MISKTYRRKKYTDIEAFKMENPYSFKNPLWFAKAFKEGKITMQKNGDLHFYTSNGIAKGKIGDMIVKNGQGCIYPVLPDVFEELYEEV